LSPEKRPGGFYKDDGPGDNARLASIPDAVPRAEPLHRYANRPYEAMGRKYVPLTRVGVYKQRGTASWYGKRFHGNPTSSGEKYDMYKMTAAHPILPIPSYVRVTNLANGRTVVVRVNDRGPFHKERVIDLSYAAAAKLGYVGAGSARVLVEQIVWRRAARLRLLRPRLPAWSVLRLPVGASAAHAAARRQAWLPTSPAASSPEKADGASRRLRSPS
jgi:rare lipoprotein A